jgi:hypothetical protein
MAMSKFNWTRSAVIRGNHLLKTRAGTYEVRYVATGSPGAKFVGKLNGRDLAGGVSGPNVDVVKRQIERRIRVARRIAAMN